MQRLSIQARWSAFASLANIVSRFVAGIVIARLLGPTGTGRVVYMFWVAETMDVVCGFGLQNSAARFAADLRGQGLDDQVERLTRWLYRRYLSFIVIGAAVMGVLAAFRAPSTELRLWEVLLVYFLLQGLSTFYTTYLGGMKRFDTVARQNLLSGAVLVTATTIGTKLFGPVGALAGYFLGAAPIALPSLRLLVSRGGHDGGIDPALKRRCMKYAVSTWVAAIVSAIVWSRMEIFFLDRYWNPRIVAMFTIGISLSYLATQGPLLLTGPLMPHFAGLFGAQDYDRIRRAYSDITRLLAAMLFPLCFGLASIAPVLLPLIYGKAFAPAVPTAMVLIAISALSFSGVGSMLLYGLERPHFIAISGAVGAVVALTSCFVVIPRWGIWGAACCRTAVQTGMTIWALWYIQKRAAVPAPVQALGKIILASILSASSSYAVVWCWPSVVGVALGIPIAAIVYVVAARALRLLEPGDIQLFESAFFGTRPLLQKRVIQFVRWMSAFA